MAVDLQSIGFFMRRDVDISRATYDYEYGGIQVSSKKKFAARVRGNGYKGYINLTNEELTMLYKYIEHMDANF